MTDTDDLDSQQFYYGTKAELKPTDLVEPGHRASSDEQDQATNYVYFGTLDAAAWEAELAPGDGPGRIYLVEPTGPVMEVPSDTDGDRPGPRVSYRSPEPLRVAGQVTDSQGRPPRLYHGTKADLKPGNLIKPGHSANFGEQDRVANHVYLAGTLDAAVWAAELARGDGPGRVYVVEPTGPIMDDPNLTNAKFPGNPTKSYRSQEPLRVTAEVSDWQGHPSEIIEAMKDGLKQLRERGADVIDD